MGLVLVVEDDADLSALIADVVEERGHEVRTAPDGRAALELVSQRMPDLILLDIKMPVMSGPEFAARFHEEYGRATPIVVMSASESAAMRSREVGADAWLSKPFEVEELLSVLDSYAKPARSSRGEG